MDAAAAAFAVRELDEVRGGEAGGEKAKGEREREREP